MKHIKTMNENMKQKKTSTISLDSIKDSDGWMELVHELKFEQFKNENSELDKGELYDKFYTEIVSKIFEHGEYANIEIEIDEDLNIVGGRIIPYKK
jgi:hypothetical protein